MPPLRVGGGELAEIDQSRIRTSKMADRNNNSNLILNSKQEFDQIRMENSNLKQSADGVRDPKSHQKSSQNVPSALVRGANSN